MIQMIRWIGISAIIACTSLVTLDTVSAATGKWVYSIYTIDASTKKATRVEQWIEKNKARVLVLCMKNVKKLSSSGVQCIWDNKIIYKKAPQKPKTPIIKKAPTLIKKTSTIKTPTVLEETKTFDGYIDGRIGLQVPDMSRAKSLETCILMMRANPQAEITCRWWDEILDSRIIETLIEAGKIELIKTPLTTATGNYLARNKEQEIWAFALQSGSGNTEKKIENIILRNIGSTRLLAVAESDSSARLIDIESGKAVSATTKITDSTIEFQNMSESLSWNTTRHYKVLISIGNVPDTSDSSTIALTLDKEKISLTDSNTRALVPIVWGPLTLKSYTLGKTTPTLTLVSVGENLFRMEVKNTDENYPLTISTIGASIHFVLQSGKQYSGMLCARDMWVGEACSTNGSTPIAVPSQGNSISLLWANINKQILPKSSTTIDLYISSNDIYPTGSQTQIIIDNLVYVIDGKTLTEQFGWLTTSRSTYSK